MPTVHRVLNLPTAATNGGTSNVGEPSVAISGNRILATGNWYAARSLTGGASWQYLDPDTYLIPQPPTAFCCDQTAIHDPSRNLIVYALQYRKNSNGNTLRLAVSRGATLVDADWVWWDLTPSGVDASWTDEWFDYNHLALSDNFLYVGTNMFSIDPEAWRRSIVMRVSLDQLAGLGEDDELDPLPQGRTRRQPLGRHRLHDAGRQAGRERPAAHRRVQRLAGRRLASPASTCFTTSHVSITISMSPR